jgi:hypothetical protein
MFCNELIDQARYDEPSSDGATASSKYMKVIMCVGWVVIHIAQPCAANQYFIIDVVLLHMQGP